MSDANASIAVFVRTHIVNLKVAHILADLRSRASYDLFVLANETGDVIFDFADYEKVSFCLDDLVKYGADISFPASALYYSDILLSICQEKKPSYKYYIMIEYDVHFLYPELMPISLLSDALLSHDGIDVASAWAGPRDGGWMWHAGCATLFPNVIGTFFPIIVASKKAISINAAARLLEGRTKLLGAPPIFCEAMLPSSVVDAGGVVKDLNELVPNFYGDNIFRPDLRDEDVKAFMRGVSAVHSLHPAKNLSSVILDDLIREIVEGIDAAKWANSAEGQRWTMQVGRKISELMSADRSLIEVLKVRPRIAVE